MWAPNVNLGVHKANRHRLCVGHYAQRGLAGPARSTRQERLTLEVTDLNVLRVKTSGSMASVIAELFPPPTRWRQVWSTVGKRIEGHLYAWAAVPPSPDFVLFRVWRFFSTTQCHHSLRVGRSRYGLHHQRRTTGRHEVPLCSSKVV